MPEIPYSSVETGLSAAELSEVKAAGCTVIRGAVSGEEARDWDRVTREYIAANRDKVKGTRSIHAYAPVSQYGSECI